MSWNPFKAIRERFQRATIGGIMDGMNAIEPDDDSDFIVEIRLRKIPALPTLEEAQAIEDVTTGKKKGGAK